jgi:hypothetical protein
LNERSANWARFSAGVCGAKVHVIYDADADRPIYAAVSTANVNDITMAQQMPIEPGVTYVFDLGYYDYAWWASLDAAACRIVTRFKSNTPLAVVKELAVPAGSNILSDRIGFLPARQAKSRTAPRPWPGHVSSPWNQSVVACSASWLPSPACPAAWASPASPIRTNAPAPGLFRT